MPREVDIETLRLLVAVHEEGSLSAAARRLGISQPAATSRVRGFEARWQLAVLHRSARGSSMTTDGLAVVAWARSVLNQCDLMLAGLDALSSERATAVTVAASLTIAEFILPQWLGELHTTVPDVRPKLHVVNSDRVANLVREGNVDLGFIEIASTPPDLQSRVVGSDRLIVVVAPNHPWARSRHTVGVEALRRARWVMREPGSGTRSTFESAVRSKPLIALESSSTTALIGAAAAGVGPAVMSSRAVASEVTMGRLIEVRTELDMVRPLSAVWRPEARLSAPVLKLLKIAGASYERVQDEQPPSGRAPVPLRSRPC